jgi:Dolichyl-phosphate-mannose-protein mannosyltransferase
VILLVASVLFALAAGAAAARLGRADDESRATTITRGLLGAVAAIVLVEESLGVVWCLGPRTIALALAVVAAGLWLAARRAGRGAAPPSRASWTALEAGLVVALVVGLATRLQDGPHRTTFLYDTLSYHLHAPATWLRDGRLSIVPAVFGDPAPAYAPSNVELLFFFIMAPTHSGALAQAGQAPLAALACVAIAATVREAGGPRAAALGAALAFLLVPEIWQQATSAMTDVGTAAFLLAALPFLVRAGRRSSGPLLRAPRLADAVFFGGAVGLGAGSKVVGAVLALPLVIAGAVVCARSARRAQVLGVATLAAAATGGFWYARNVVVACNPLYPLAVKLGAMTVWPGVYDAAVLRASDYHVATDALAALGQLLLEPGFSFALGGAVALVAGARRRPAWTALAVAFVALFWLALPYQESRFLFVAWGAVAVALGTLARAEAPWTWAPLALAALGGVVEHPTVERGAALGAGAVMLVAFGPARAVLATERARRLRRALVPASALAGAVFVIVAAFRAPVAVAYSVGDDLDDAWAWVRAHVRDTRVAYTGNNLPFPLAGDDLSNDVRYVNVAGAAEDRLHDFARRAPRAFTGPEPAPYRDDARYATWLANLRATRRALLFVAALDPGVRRTIAADADGFPVERAWADSHPERFTLRFASGAARVYGVAP